MPVASCANQITDLATGGRDGRRAPFANVTGDRQSRPGFGFVRRDAGNRVPLRARSRRGADVEPARRRAASSTSSSPTSSATPRRRAPARGAQPRQVERVDVTEFFSDATRELLQRAAQTALEWGSLDLDTDHLLHAALQDDVVRHVLRPDRRRPGSDRGAARGRGREGASGRTSRPRSRLTRRRRCSPPTTSRASSAPRTSGRSTCCSRSPRRRESTAGRAAPALRRLAHEAPRRRHPRRRGDGRPRETSRDAETRRVRPRPDRRRHARASSTP